MGSESEELEEEQTRKRAGEAFPGERTRGFGLGFGFGFEDEEPRNDFENEHELLELELELELEIEVEVEVVMEFSNTYDAAISLFTQTTAFSTL